MEIRRALQAVATAVKPKALTQQGGFEQPPPMKSA
jgi:hypothetical protein